MSASFGQTREEHLGAGNLAARIFQIFLQGRLIPGDAGILVGIAVGVVRISAGLAADDAVQHRPDRILGAFADLVAGLALEKHLLAKSRVLSGRGAHRARERQGSEYVDLKICHWPIRDLRSVGTGKPALRQNHRAGGVCQLTQLCQDRESRSSLACYPAIRRLAACGRTDRKRTSSGRNRRGPARCEVAIDRDRF